MTTKKMVCWVLWFLGSSGIIAFAGIQEPRNSGSQEPSQVAKAVSKTYREFRDVQMPFRQKKFVTIMRNPIESSGTILWRPNRVLFRTQKPETSEVLITDKVILIWVPELRKIEKYDRTRFRLLDSLNIGVGQNVEKMLSQYKVTVNPAREKFPGDPEAIVLRCEPTEKQIKKYIKMMWMWVRKKDHLIYRIEYTDSTGDRTLTEFSIDKMKTNQGLTDKNLKLAAPRGTRIVEPMKGDR